MKRRVTWKEFTRWRAFNAIDPIDARLRMDAAIARLAYVALRQLGNKKVKFEDFLPFPVKTDKGRKTKRNTGPASKRAPAGLDPEVFKAFGVKADG